MVMLEPAITMTPHSIIMLDPMTTVLFFSFIEV